MSTITYRARAGAPWNDEDAERLMPELLSYSGKTADEIVLAVKKKPESELYQELEWNNSIAGHRFRCGVISSMQSCFVEVKLSAQETTVGPAGIWIEARELDPEDDRLDRRGRPVKVIISPAFAVEHGFDIAAMKLEQAQRDLVNWKRRYDPYRAEWKRHPIQKAFNVAERLEEKMRTQPPPDDE
jgi:hypothetical protein